MSGSLSSSPAGTPRDTLKGQLGGLIRLQKSVFRDDELPNIAAHMINGEVTSLEAHLRIEKSAGDVVSTSVSIRGIGAPADLLARIDQAIQANCAAADLEVNLPADPAPTNNAPVT